MNNTNNGLPQGVITNNNTQKTPGVIAPTPPSAQNPQNLVTNQPKKKVEYSKRNNGKLIVIVILLAIVSVLAYLVMSGKKSIFTPKKEEEKKEIVAIDLDTDWGKKFSVDAQRLYEDREIDVYEVAFINVDFKDYPEMLIRFTDKYEKNYMLVYSYDKNTDNVNISKLFSSASIKLLYSLRDGYSEWYMSVKPTDNYFTYTRLSKIVSGKVTGSDIKSSNDKELNEFRNTYAISNYDPVFYEVKKEKFEESFKTMYERTTQYDEEIKKERTALDEKYRSSVKKYEDEGEYLQTGKTHLTFGGYVQYVNPESNYVPNAKYNGFVITLNRDRTINMNGAIYKFTIENNVLFLDDGTIIRVNYDDKMQIDTDGGVVFTCLNPYIPPEEPKKDNGEENNE